MGLRGAGSPTIALDRRRGGPHVGFRGYPAGMNPTAPLPLLVLPLLVSAPAPAPAPAPAVPRAAGETIAVSREEGSRLTKTISIVQSMESEEESFLVDGEQPEGMSGIERSTKLELELEITDEVLEADGDEVMRLRRTFDDLAQSFHGEFTDPSGDTQEIDGEGECPLVGHAVVFHLEDGEYVASFDEDDEGEDEDLLAGLDPFFDLDGFLPEDEVEVGEGWDVPLEVFQALRSPCGKLPVFSEDADEEARDREIEALANDREEPELDGDLGATLEAVREEDGHRLAVIALSVDVEQTNDRTDSIEEQTEDAEEGMIHPDIDSFVETRTWEGEGKLVWDLTAGHAVSLDLELDKTESTEVEMTLEVFDETQEMEQKSVLAGTVTVAVRFEE